jgi:hypothetical protein
MSVSPEPPERLAKILQEILVLSNSKRTSQSESAGDNHEIDAHCVKEQWQGRHEDGNNQQ